jgi:curved DNA-binding protein CbpA
VYQEAEAGEPAGARFIRIQAAYELLMDREARGNYDRDHKRNPFMVSLVISADELVPRGCQSVLSFCSLAACVCERAACVVIKNAEQP